ncbi:hypothetical protein [Pontixanthobacter gangjinensis]
MKLQSLAITVAAAAMTISAPALAQDASLEARFQILEQRIQALEAQNQELREELEAEPESREAVPALRAPQAVPPAPVQAIATEQSPDGIVGTNSAYSYKILDHSENVNTRPLVQLNAIANGQLKNRVTLSGGATVLMDKQWSNTADKFGYLMRNPTSANQIGKDVSEAVIHSAQLAVTARLDDDFTAYAELLYDPQQSFGQGTITALTRNQIQLRRGWVMFGNLEKRPVYALVGKMDTPFGLNDSVSPFTNSTSWHAFSGLAYGAQVGLETNGLSLRAMAIQGGAQFRAANVPVNGTSVPSRLNNFAVDARYTTSLGGEGNQIMAGASYQHGSAYCQGYPVVHFTPCQDNNPEWAAYGKVNYGDLTLIGEYASTTKPLPGSAVPIPNNPLSAFPAVKTEAFTAGGRYAFGPKSSSQQGRQFAVSGEFSKFIAGADGAPWERQNQAVFGLSWFASANINLFSEFVHVDGFVPLNFLSGGNFPDGSTWSDRDANTNVALVGAQVAF